MNKNEYIIDRLKSIDIVINEEQAQQFVRFYELMIEKNKVMNLTSITDFQEVVEKHFMDSLMVNHVVHFIGTESVIDVGTGAGFPGIPLKIIFPDLDLVLMDSVNKRLKFIDEVVEELNLQKVRTVHARAEDMANQKEYRENFDYCLSRAVANLSTLAELCLPFVKIGGKFISYKAGEIEEEVSSSALAAKVLANSKWTVQYFNIPDTQIQRSFVSCVKIKITPKKYPRKAGLPGKEPIH